MYDAGSGHGGAEQVAFLVDEAALDGRPDEVGDEHIPPVVNDHLVGRWGGRGRKWSMVKGWSAYRRLGLKWIEGDG